MARADLLTAGAELDEAEAGQAAEIGEDDEELAEGTWESVDGREDRAEAASEDKAEPARPSVPGAVASPSV